MPFWCVDGPSQKLCVTLAPYHGPGCDVSLGASDCPQDGMICTDASPFAEPQLHHECRMPCQAGRCPVIGGLPHVCLTRIDGGCYPGEFGMPCVESAECIRPMSCHPVELEGREAYPETMICTIECESDADCDGGKTGAVQDGYCDAGHRCRLPALPGKPCERAEHCRRRRCEQGTCFE